MKLIGIGIFMWFGSERQTDRYGAFYLADSSYKGKKPKLKAFTDPYALEPLVGRRVRIVAKVVENRSSGHIGDLFHGLFPNPLKKGKELELAIGRIHTRVENNIEFIEVRPDDSRQEFWIDPRKFFQLHDQTVEIYAEVDDITPAHPRFKPAGSSQDEAISNGDGTLQTKTKNPSDKFSVPATVESMGDGLFRVTPPNTKAGSRHRMVRHAS